MANSWKIDPPRVKQEETAPDDMPLTAPGKPIEPEVTQEQLDAYEEVSAPE